MGLAHVHLAIVLHLGQGAFRIGAVQDVVVRAASLLFFCDNRINGEAMSVVSLSDTRNASNITTGTLPVARGGTGTTSSTGTGNNVLSAGPTLTGTVSAATIAATNIGIGTSTLLCLSKSLPLQHSALQRAKRSTSMSSTRI
jgi:hypothetical protein